MLTTRRQAHASASDAPSTRAAQGAPETVRKAVTFNDVPFEIKDAIVEHVVGNPDWLVPDHKHELIALGSISKEFRRLVVPRLFRIVPISAPTYLWDERRSERARARLGGIRPGPSSTWGAFRAHVEKVVVFGGHFDLSFVGRAERLTEINLQCGFLSRRDRNTGPLHDPAYLLHGVDAPLLSSLDVSGLPEEGHPGAVFNPSRWLPQVLQSTQALGLQELRLAYEHRECRNLGAERTTTILQALAALRKLRLLGLEYFGTTMTWKDTATALPSAIRFDALTRLCVFLDWESNLLDIVLSRTTSLVHLDASRIVCDSSLPQGVFNLPHLRVVELTRCTLDRRLWTRFRDYSVERLTLNVCACVLPENEEEREEAPARYGTYEVEDLSELADANDPQYFAPRRWPALRRVELYATDEDGDWIDQAGLTRGESGLFSWGEEPACFLASRGVECYRCPQSFFAMTDARYQKAEEKR